MQWPGTAKARYDEKSLRQEILEKVRQYNSISLQVKPTPAKPCRTRLSTLKTRVSTEPRRQSREAPSKSEDKNRTLDSAKGPSCPAKSDRPSLSQGKGNPTHRIRKTSTKSDSFTGQQCSSSKLDYLQANRTPSYIVGMYRALHTSLNQRQRSIDALLSAHPEFMELAGAKQVQGAGRLAVGLLEKAVGERDLQLFVVVVQFLGDFYYGSNWFAQAIYFYIQLRLAATYLGSPSKKIDALVSLSKCAGKQLKGRESTLLLLKALEYAYLSEDEERELHVYDLLGLRFFYSGQLKESRYFHQRFANGIKEHSGIRSRAYTSARQNYIRYSSSVQTIALKLELSALFVAHLTLPLRSCSSCSLSDCRLSVDSLMQDPEFVSVIDLPKQPVREVQLAEPKLHPTTRRLVTRNQEQVQPLGPRLQGKQSDSKGWLERAMAAVRSRHLNSQSLRGRALLSHDWYSNMLLKRRGGQFFNGFLFKGMLIEYLQLATRRQVLSKPIVIAELDRKHEE